MGMRTSLAVLAVLGLSVGVAQAQTAWPDECKLHRVATFKMTDHGTVITIPVMVNGVEKNFMVDTGGYVTSVNAATAKTMGMALHAIKFNQILDVSGKAATQYAVAESFKLGAMEAKNFELKVDDGDTAGAFDGVLAPDLLRNFDVEFDFASHTLNLFRPHGCDGKAAYWTQEYIAIPLEITPAGHTRVDVMLDGETMGAIIDSGASLSVMSFGAARRYFDLNADSPGVTKAGHLMGSTGNEVDAYRYDFKSLAMGGVSVSHPRLALSDSPSILLKENASLLFGMTELRYLHLYFAYHEHKLYVSAAAAH
jgi:predicted aspartyl protease